MTTKDRYAAFRKPTPLKFCQKCKVKMERRGRPGHRESIAMFIARKFCGHACAALASRKPDTESTAHAIYNRKYMRDCRRKHPDKARQAMERQLFARKLKTCGISS